MADGNAVAGGSGWSRWNWHAFLNVSAVRSDATSVTYGVTLGYSSYYAINVHANGGIDGGRRPTTPSPATCRQLAATATARPARRSR